MYGVNPLNACTAPQIQETVAAYFRSYKQLFYFGFAQRLTIFIIVLLTHSNNGSGKNPLCLINKNCECLISNWAVFFTHLRICKCGGCMFIVLYQDLSADFTFHTLVLWHVYTYVISTRGTYSPAAIWALGIYRTHCHLYPCTHLHLSEKWSHVKVKCLTEGHNIETIERRETWHFPGNLHQAGIEHTTGCCYWKAPRSNHCATFFSVAIPIHNKGII